MDDLRNRIIATILGAIFGGLTTGGIAALTDKTDETVKRNEFLTTENARLKSTLSNKESRISFLENQLNTSEKNYKTLNFQFQELTAEYQILDNKYKKCISSNGLTENIGSIDLKSYSRQFRTGDNLKFDLTSTPLEIKFVRVSDRGPIMEICNCLNYLTLNSTAITSSNENQYLLQLGKSTKIRFTVKSCENEDAIEPSELEEIEIKLIDFNTQEQTFHLQYHRDFLIK